MISSQADANVKDWNDKEYLLSLVIYAWDDEH